MGVAWYTAIFLGLVQGLAEFLPISSSGHLLWLQHWLGVGDGGLLFTVILHLGSLLAVVVVYWRRLWWYVCHPFSRECGQLALATVVTCLLVLVGKRWVEPLFSYRALPFTFFASAVVLLVPAFVKTKPRVQPWRQSVLVGLAQGVAVLPGLSRSGLTITMGLLAGKSPRDAADFSFLLSVPIILASLVYELLFGGAVVPVAWGSLAWAFLAAFGAGLVAIKGLLALVRRADFRWFAGYLLIVSVFLLFHGGF